MHSSFRAGHALLGALISMSLFAGAASARPVERPEPKQAVDHRAAVVGDSGPKQLVNRPPSPYRWPVMMCFFLRTCR